MNILFIGNSFTYFNDMPTMLEQMSLSNGHKAHVEQITYGGYSLVQYLEPGSKEAKQVLDTLNERQWDFVVLQDQSKKPDSNKAEFLSSVDSLNHLVLDNGARTVLYSTWSYKDGSDMLRNTGYTYQEFYNSLTLAYMEAETKNNTLRAAVGTVFFHLTMEEPSINLYADDDFHPSLAGSYVAAYTFYTLLFGDTNNNEYLPSDLLLSTANILRSYVLKTVKETQ